MAELNRLGLEHFGLRAEKLAAERDSLEFQSAMYSSQRCAATSMRAYLRDSLWCIRIRSCHGSCHGPT